ncbi:hypothetical protein [Pseudomonas chlororaphis]|uniref:hypothetical protein n=1 Tax=Pseudomonas chlororaphis TaxID=587753 RepID=UPI000BE26C1D|nr:hypothetical protein [Pseudomonas chlororaphis]
MPEIKERPILFSAPMVRAILEGRKTVTRRVMKFQPGADASVTVERYHPTVTDRHGNEQPGPEVFGAWWQDGEYCCKSPYGQPGHRLWVRETWGLQVRHYGGGTGEHIVYRATNPDAIYCKSAEGQEYPVKWKPSIHMPRHSSRIQLEITDVRVERLQDGEGETAFESRYLAEGIHRIHHGDGDYYYHPFKSEPGPGNWIDPFDAWRELWMSVNGAESWNVNPWVWVVEFRRVQP